MSRPIVLACLSVVTLAGCGHTVYRETVVEKQPVVTRETVVERPVVAPATVVAVPATGAMCSMAGGAYSQGTLSCQSGYQYQCVDGVWQPLRGTSC